MALRFLVATSLAFLITFGLFFLMQVLIAAGNFEVVDDSKRIRVELGKVREVEEVREVERRPEEVKPEPLPDTEIQMTYDIGNVSDPVNLSVSNVGDTEVNTGFGISFVPDGEYLPIVRVPPQYPARAAERGLEGYVIVEFTVTPTGSTAKAIVIESSDRVFERNAIRAALKFKYKPKVVDGEPVYVDGVRTRIDFKLDD